jgi:hypothetical protein
MIAMWLAQRASRPLRWEREFSKAKPAGRVLLLVDFFSSFLVLCHFRQAREGALFSVWLRARNDTNA